MEKWKRNTIITLGVCLLIVGGLLFLMNRNTFLKIGEKNQEPLDLKFQYSTVVTESTHVNFIVHGMTDLAGWEFDVDYNPKIVYIKNVAEGDIFKGGQSIFIKGEDILGKYRNVADAKLDTVGVSGDGLLLSIDMGYLVQGSPDISLSNVILSDSKGNPIPYKEGMIEIQSIDTISNVTEKVDNVPSVQKTVSFEVNISEYINKGDMVTLTIEESKDGINWKDMASSTRDGSLAYDDKGNRDDFIRISTTLPNEISKIRSVVTSENSRVNKNYTWEFK